MAFIKKTQISLFIVIAILLSVLLGFTQFTLYRMTQNVMQSVVTQNLVTSATLAAEQFTTLTQIDIESGSVEFLEQNAKKLDRIVTSIPSARYAYLVRSSTTPNEVQYIAENDMFYDFSQLDRNNNGVIDPNEETIKYNESMDVSTIPALQSEAFISPTSDDSFTVDQWGTWMSAYAPVRDASGTVLAVLGIDITADDYVQQVGSIFSTAYLALKVIAIIVIGSMLLLVNWFRSWYFERKLDFERRNIVRKAVCDLGDPISALNWWIELLDEQDSIDKHEAIDTVKQAAAKLNDVVRNLQGATGSQEPTECPTAL